MKHILIIGAGRSTTALIQYLLSHAASEQWKITIADADFSLAQSKAGGDPNAVAVELDAMNAELRQSLVNQSDLVVSMLPPKLHIEVAKDCLQFKKHLVNASYTSDAVQAMDAEVKAVGLTFMCEIGLDPGIDHMSAMLMLDDIREKGGVVTAFRSYTGGLVAPMHDDNPWHYKFSWAPRNVVLAGQGTAQYIENGQLRFIPYHRVFEQIRPIEVPGAGAWEAYANRNSLAYIPIYGLENVPTLIRGTIRGTGFCSAWNCLIKLGMTDDLFLIPNASEMTYKQLMKCLTFGGKGGVRDQVARVCGLPATAQELDKLEWLGLFSDEKIPIKSGSPADVLEKLLLEKWKLGPEEKDMIIMQHEIEYMLGNQRKFVTSTLIQEGNNSSDTAMSRLVGLPMGIFIRHLLSGHEVPKGVVIPIQAEVYKPVLKELSEYGVSFKEYVMNY
jgi:saccharopine dehydrogenase-like NADP-dependent oxidoreductase